MTENEILKAMSDMLHPILEKVTKMETDMLEMKKDIAELKSDVSTLKSDVSEIKETVNHNYNLTLEFYGIQKEHNTEVSDMLDTISGELDMHNNQIARNTAAIKRYK